MKRFWKFASLLLLTLMIAQSGFSWGFWGHQRINRMAVFTLPPEMLKLYKLHIEYLTDHAVDPDKRRYAVDWEAPRHYMDADHYGSYPFEMIPRKWYDAVEKYSEDTLQSYGIVPWAIHVQYLSLVKAFQDKNLDKILKISADLGHYIADSNVPLHTTENYNGQMTGQRGIHGLWESRLPEIFGLEYNYFIGPSQYLENPLDEAWKSVLESHAALDSVLGFERKLTELLDADRKYSFENRNDILTRQYSREFSSKYHQMLNGQVERRIRSSLRRVGSIWFTAWVDAGQPNLDELLMKDFDPGEEDLERKLKIQDRESDAVGFMDPYFGPERRQLPGHACGHDHAPIEYKKADFRHARFYPPSLKLIFHLKELVG